MQFIQFAFVGHPDDPRAPFTVYDSRSTSYVPHTTLRGGHRENSHPQEVAPLAGLQQWYVPDQQQKL